MISGEDFRPQTLLNPFPEPFSPQNHSSDCRLHVPICIEVRAAKSASHIQMTKKRVFSIEGSQTHPVPHVETTMTSLGNFRPALNMSIALPGCSLYLLWYGPSGISPSRGPTTPHLASVTFDALHMTLFRASKIGSSQPLHISLPLHLNRTAEKSVHKTRSLSKACGVPSLQILYRMVPPSTQQTEVRLCMTITTRYGARGVVIT